MLARTRRTKRIEKGGEKCIHKNVQKKEGSEDIYQGIETRMKKINEKQETRGKT